MLQFIYKLNNRTQKFIGYCVIRGDDKFVGLLSKNFVQYLRPKCCAQDDFYSRLYWACWGRQLLGKLFLIFWKNRAYSLPIFGGFLTCWVQKNTLHQKHLISSNCLVPRESSGEHLVTKFLPRKATVNLIYLSKCVCVWVYV